MDVARENTTGGPRPIAPLSAATAYCAPEPRAPIDLKLDSNEGAAPPDHLLNDLLALSARQSRSPFVTEEKGRPAACCARASDLATSG